MVRSFAELRSAHKSLADVEKYIDGMPNTTPTQIETYKWLARTTYELDTDDPDLAEASYVAACRSPH
jgi:hypothetical protein